MYLYIDLFEENGGRSLPIVYFCPKYNFVHATADGIVLVFENILYYPIK